MTTQFIQLAVSRIVGLKRDPQLSFNFDEIKPKIFAPLTPAVVWAVLREDLLTLKVQGNAL